MSTERNFDIDLRAVKKAGELARIQLTEEEARQFQKQISEVLRAFDKINTIAIEGVAPLVSPLEQTVTMREDKVESHEEINKVLEQAPDVQGRLFRVPPVV